MRRSLSFLFGALTLILLASACGGNDESASSAPVPTQTVVLRDSLYKPDNIAIEAGDTVTWVWEDGSVPHDVKSTDDDEKYGSKVQTTGTFTHTFERPGRFSYFCSLHPQMRGTVRVS